MTAPVIISPNPVDYVFVEANVERNHVYGDDLYQTLNYYRNPTRLDAGNPVLVVPHGGAGTSYDKTSLFESVNRFPMGWIGRYLLDPAYPTTAVPFDIAVLEHPGFSHTNSNSANFEPQLDDPAITNGDGAISFQVMLAAYIDSIQRGTQYIMRRASYFGCDKSRIVHGGYSYAGMGSGIAALTPSRPWDPKGLVGDATDEFRSRGVINVSGEIYYSPEEIEHTTLRYLLGITGTDNTYAGAVRAQINAATLIPKSDGTFDSTCERNEFCKSHSLMDLIARATSSQKSIQWYNLYDVQDTTPTPILGYPAVPPVNRGGHSSEQGPRLGAQLTAYGFTHTTTTFDTGSAGALYQSAIEAKLPGIYAAMRAMVGL